jgi:hypothetical protein
MPTINKIMFVHPSRGRPEMAVEAIVNIISTMTSGVPYTYYLSLDRDDPKLPGYYSIIESAAHTNLITGLVVADNPHEVVQATNRAAALIDDEDVIICQTDDYQCQQGWDRQLMDFAANLPDVYLIHCPNFDGTDHHLAWPQIISKALYKKLGYVLYPKYISMGADVDLYEVANKLNAAFLFQPAPFEHKHPRNGRRDFDETTIRTNLQWKYDVAREVMKKRREDGFV